uniref:Ig-like domain-containing protein n=1 Tax=uncultured Finegoldia sp. TaxID=328009 RepID=UPI0025EFE74D
MDKKNKNNIAKILLAFGVLASPVMLANQVSADNSIGNSIGNTTDTNKIQQNTESDTATTYNVIKENKEEKEQAKEVVSTAAENNKADATKEATTTKDTAIETTETTSQKEEATEEKEEAVIEGKEAFKLTDSQRQALKNASFTDGEIAKIEEDIANSLAENPNIDVDAKLNKKIQEANAKEANSLEVAPEGEKASQKAGKGQQVNNKVHVSNINIQYKDGGSQKEEVWVTSAGHAAFTADYKVDDDVKSGDYFTVSYGDNVVPGLVNEPRTATNLMDARGRMIAQGIYDKDSNTTTYTFTDYVDIFNNVRGSFQQSLWPVREQITDDGQKVDVTITVADETKTRNMTFQYGNKKYLPITETITSVNREENTVHTTTYINQSGDRIGGLNKIKLESNNYEYTDPSQVKIYEVSNNAVFRDSFSPNLAAGAKEVTDLPITVENGIAYIDVGTKLNMKTKYVVLGTPTLKKDADPNKAVKVTSSVVNKNNGQVVVDNHGQTVSHTSALLQAGDTSTGEGDQEEQPGSFQEHHIYLTKDKDGNVIEEKTIKKDGETTKGSKTEFYKTGKKEEDGYTFVRTENPVNNPIYNNDGSKSAGNYVPGVKQEITYVYEKTVDEPAEEPGSFQEHHIYITKDEDGNIIEEKTIKEDGKVKEGTKDETYPTGKNEKDGYTFVRTENPVNEPTYNEDGTPTEGNFKPGEKQEITYVYEKTITTKGSFQDHHIYQTVDKNGKVISTDDNKDGKEQTGKENEKYTTNKIDKEGYKLVEVKPTNDKSKELGVKYDSENGEPTKGNYVAGEKQEVTYIYQRTKEEPGSFQEHHIYITKDEDGNIIEEKTIKEDGKVKEG